MWATRKQSGFTIIELLIVIVVIAILAAISIVAYNGIQQRARNTQTLNAVTAWVKALKLYQADKGEWPKIYDSCLGDTSQYRYDFSAASSGDNQCHYASFAYYNVKSPFINLMRQYIGEGSVPTPYMSTVGTSTDWYRGAAYLYGIPTPGVARVYVQYALAGVTSKCNDILGIVASRSEVAGGVVCTLQLGDQPI